MFKGGIEGPGAAQALSSLGLDGFPVTATFRGDIGQTLTLATPGLRTGGLLLVGLGRIDATDPTRLRRAAGVAARAAAKVARVATTLAAVHPSPEAIGAVAEGFHLGAYADLRYRSEPEPAALREVTILVPSAVLPQARAALARAEVYARATCLARDLVNAPPDRKRPADLAEEIAGALPADCSVAIRDEAWLAARSFGGLLGVGQGSDAPPRLVEIVYDPPEALGHLVLVGKGITFDTGGLSLKRPPKQIGMKSDMAGAAAVAATLSALGALDVRTKVTGLLPLAENMPGADAQRPGDVITTHAGTTVEVIDTDAEGRLVLADALAYGAAQQPDAIVDLATLTYSAMEALGAHTAALFSDDQDLADALTAAGQVAGEALWRLPLIADLEPALDSPIADLNNLAKATGAGAVTAALFLRRFVGDLPWAHLDIAGPAWLEKRDAGAHLPVGGTGFGVRTLLSWLERRTP